MGQYLDSLGIWGTQTKNFTRVGDSIHSLNEAICVLLCCLVCSGIISYCSRSFPTITLFRAVFRRMTGDNGE